MGQIVGLRETSGGRHIALTKQRQHLRGRDLRHALHEILFARGSIGLS